MSMDRHFSYKDFTPVPPPRPPVNYSDMSDLRFIQSVATTVATAIVLPWLCYRLYYSRLCCAKTEGLPLTFHTREIGLMLLALVAWSTGSNIATSLSLEPLARRFYILMTIACPMLVFFASTQLDDWMGEPPAFPLQAVFVMLAGLGLSFLTI